MIKKYSMIILAFCFFMLFSISDVIATEVSDREIAIACILASGNHDDEKFVKDDLGEGPDRIKTYADRHELDDWFIVDFSNNWLPNLGMTALVLEKDNNVIISFRGTDTEWLEDAVNGVLNFHIQELPANIYVKKILKQYSKKEGNYKFYVTGYSLGGYIAQTAGATIEKESSNYPNIQLAKIMDFNGIGINFLTFLGNIGWGGHTDEIAILKKLGEEGRLVSYYIYGDIISAAGMHYGEMRSILPSIDTVSEIRTKYLLFNTAEKFLPLSRVIALLMENVLNAFKTEIYNASNTYDVYSIPAFLDLTHGSTMTEFGSLDFVKSGEEPNVIISTDNKSIDKEGLNITSSTTLKAETYNASAKVYKWYVSNDGKTWGEPIKTSSLYEKNKFESPTNTYVINIDDLKEGETKYYKVESYYDDKCISSTYTYNTKILQYEYVKNEEKSNLYNYGSTEAIIKVTHKSKVTTLKDGFASLLNKNLFSSLLDKNNYVSNIVGTITKLSDTLNLGDIGFTGIIGNFAEDSTSDLVEITETLYNSLTNVDNFETETVVNFVEIADDIVEDSKNTAESEKGMITDTSSENNVVLDEYTHEGITYRLAVPNTVLSGVINQIENQNYAEQDSNSIAYNHIQMLLGPDPKSLEYEEGTVRKLRDCINNHQVCNVHVTNDHWIVCVGYRNNVDVTKLKFEDFLFISSNNGSLITGSNSEAKGFYSLDQHDAIYPYQ